MHNSVGQCHDTEAMKKSYDGLLIITTGLMENASTYTMYLRKCPVFLQEILNICVSLLSVGLIMKLRCYVVIELKACDFEPGFISQALPEDSAKVKEEQVPCIINKI